MKPEDELQMPYVIDKRIRFQLARIEYIRSSLLPGGIAYDTDKVQGGYPGDRYAAAMGRISEIEDRIKKLEEKKKWYEDIRIPLLLDQVFDPEARNVLQLHDVMRLSMMETAEILYMSRATAYRIRESGLNDIRKFIEEERR